MTVVVLAVCVLLACTHAIPLRIQDLTTVLQTVKTAQDVATNLLASVSKSTSSGQGGTIVRASSTAKQLYDNVQAALVKHLSPQPIIDTIREEDKYGNDGEKFAKVGRKVVGGVEVFTNLLASAVDAPFTALKMLTRKASESLNVLGSKLVGL